MKAASIKSSSLICAALIAVPAVYGAVDSSQDPPRIPDYADAIKLGGDTTDPAASGAEFLFATPSANLGHPGLEKHEAGDLDFADVFKPFQASENSPLAVLGPLFNNQL